MTHERERERERDISMRRLRPINRPRRALPRPLNRIRRSTGIHPPCGSDIRGLEGNIILLAVFLFLFFLLFVPGILVVVDGEVVVADCAVNFLRLRWWGGDWFGGHFG